MKTRFFFAALLLLAFGSVKAQENENLNAKSLAVMTTGDVTIRQSDTLLVLKDEYDGKYAVQRDVITLWGTADFDVTLPELKSLTVSSTGDVVSHGVLKGSNLTIISLGAGDIELDLDCNDVVVKMSGTGDVTLRGKCHSLTPIVLGKGDLNVKGLLQEDGEVVMNGGYPNSDSATLSELMRELGVNLEHLTDSVDWESFAEDMEKWGAEMEEWGNKMERWGEGLEQRFEYPYEFESLKNDDKPVRSIVIGGSGDVRIKQSQDGFSLSRGDKATRRQPYMANGTLILGGPSDYEVAIPQLNEIILSSSGDVIGRGLIKGDNLNLVVSGSGDLKLDVDYDTIHVLMSSSGDVTLMGQCKMIYADIHGSGDLKIQQLIAGESHINATGSGEARVNKVGNVKTYHQRKNSPSTHKNLLFDAHWNGFEAGLNMLVTPQLADVYVSTGGTNGMELRPLRSWYFGFNIADVGVAFDRRHTVGLFTGIGLGWNNFSWNNDVTIEYDPDNVINTLLPVESEQEVKTSKYGALFLQAPLMVEVKPTHGMYIDLGVTAGLRIAQWNRVKYSDGNSDKHYFSGPLNQFKLDASLRVGGSDMGFFANYALLPIFSFGNEQKAHPISFGFSINF